MTLISAHKASSSSWQCRIKTLEALVHSEKRGPLWGRGLGRGCPLPRDGGLGVSPRKNFEISDAIWCNLVHFGKKLTILQFSTFVNENIAVMLESGLT